MHFLYLLAKDFPNISSFKANFNCTQSSLLDLKKPLSFFFCAMALGARTRWFVVSTESLALRPCRRPSRGLQSESQMYGYWFSLVGLSGKPAYAGDVMKECGGNRGLNWP